VTRVWKHVNVCSPAFSQTVNVAGDHVRHAGVNVHGVRERRIYVYINVFQRSAGWCTQPAFT